MNFYYLKKRKTQLNSFGFSVQEKEKILRVTKSIWINCCQIWALINLCMIAVHIVCVQWQKNPKDWVLNGSRVKWSNGICPAHKDVPVNVCFPTLRRRFHLLTVYHVFEWVTSHVFYLTTLLFCLPHIVDILMHICMMIKVAQLSFIFW